MEVAEYSEAMGISDEPAFSWWTPHVFAEISCSKTINHLLHYIVFVHIYTGQDCISWPNSAT